MEPSYFVFMLQMDGPSWHWVVNSGHWPYFEPVGHVKNAMLDNWTAGYASQLCIQANPLAGLEAELELLACSSSRAPRLGGADERMRAAPVTTPRPHWESRGPSVTDARHASANPAAYPRTAHRTSSEYTPNYNSSSFQTSNCTWLCSEGFRNEQKTLQRGLLLVLYVFLFCCSSS